MKIIKLKLKEKFKCKRKVIIKNLILNIFIGFHNFEKKKNEGFISYWISIGFTKPTQLCDITK